MSISQYVYNKTLLIVCLQIHKRINKGAKQRLRTQLAAYKVLQGTNQYLEMTDSFKSFLNRKRLADFRSS